MAFSTDIFGGCDGLFYCLALWANTVTEGYFWSIILLAFGIIVFMGTINFGGNRAFGYSTMAVGLGALTLIQIGLIPLWILTLSMIIAVIGVVVMLMNQR